MRSKDYLFTKNFRDNNHDTMFYNALDWAEKKNFFLTDLFGPQDHFYKHALVRAASQCTVMPPPDPSQPAQPSARPSLPV